MRRVWIAVFPDVQTLEVTGPLEVFSIANRLGAARTPRYAVWVVAAKRDVEAQRVEAARRLLESTCRSVAEVAERCGFARRRHFRAS